MNKKTKNEHDKFVWTKGSSDSNNLCSYEQSYQIIMLVKSMRDSKH